ncbi:hypothetical protein Taro_037872 [Colocasia esculenta]|uniref:Uncharacterized protein n=1 Tax=Colocasia esculenta TaxID=4460 RepID=A0A843WKJ2_COLES|nr:hypothetical protein [Colocasia esculenta]
MRVSPQWGQGTCCRPLASPTTTVDHSSVVDGALSGRNTVTDDAERGFWAVCEWELQHRSCLVAHQPPPLRYLSINLILLVTNYEYISNIILK